MPAREWTMAKAQFAILFERPLQQGHGMTVSFNRPAIHGTYGPPRLQAISRPSLISLRQRIRSQGIALAKMEIRASWSS